MAAVLVLALGFFGEPSLWPASDVVGDLDVAAFAGVPRHAAGYEGRGGHPFLQGVNQLIAHGWPYSPPQAGEPGWRFYAAAVFNNHNPWWLVMPDITAVPAARQFLLRQGEPANDVAIYLPTDDT